MRDQLRVTPGAVSGIPRTYRGPREFWLLLERTGVELCIEDPGLQTDIQVEADLGTLASVWLGDLSFADAVRSKLVRLLGTRRLTNAFPGWLMLSHYGGVRRPRNDKPMSMRAHLSTAATIAAPRKPSEETRP